MPPRQPTPRSSGTIDAEALTRALTVAAAKLPAPEPNPPALVKLLTPILERRFRLAGERPDRARRRALRAAIHWSVPAAVLDRYRRSEGSATRRRQGAAPCVSIRRAVYQPAGAEADVRREATTIDRQARSIALNAKREALASHRRARAIAKREALAIDRQARAAALMQQHPDWSMNTIADAIGGRHADTRAAIRHLFRGTGERTIDQANG